MNVILDDTKFIKINGDWYRFLLKLKIKINRFLWKIKDKLGNELYNHLFTSESSFGICYGLQKIHKLGNKTRPIISFIKTFNYKLAIFFVPIFKLNSKSIPNRKFKKIRKENNLLKV